MKIDILEAYVWISEVFRVKSGFYQSTGRLPEPPGNIMGLSGPRWKRGEAKRKEAHPPSGPNWTRGAAPFSFSLCPSFLLSYSGKKRESY